VGGSLHLDTAGPKKVKKTLRGEERKERSSVLKKNARKMRVKRDSFQEEKENFG